MHRIDQHKLLEGISKPEPNALASGVVGDRRRIDGPEASAYGSLAGYVAILKCPLGIATLVTVFAGIIHAEDRNKPLTYRRFEVEEADGRVLNMTPTPDESAPRWAREVEQEPYKWTRPTSEEPLFAQPIPFVLPPADEGEPFGRHNHQPSITWLPNGDLLAIWYSTGSEQGTELTVLASRLRPGQKIRYQQGAQG